MDNPNWHQAINGSFSDQFHIAIETEISMLEKLGAWVKVKRTSIMNVIKGACAFKIKMFTNELLWKLKAQFCVCGDMQIESFYIFNTFAPVVQWVTIQTLLILVVQLNLSTTQVDYTAVFPQPKLDNEVYVEMLQGFMEPGYLYKLKKSLYDLCQSPKNFFEHLKDQFELIGFKQISTNPCLFIKDTCICIMYVDTILMFAKDDEIIISVIEDLRK